MNNKFLKVSTSFYKFLLLFIIFLPSIVSAAILPNCDPSLAPSQGGCGIPQFVQLLKNVIDFLTIIVFPIAAGVIIWGGIVIMTAGGSTERASKGKKIITTAVIGIAIALGAWLIINAIYLLLTGANVPTFD